MNTSKGKKLYKLFRIIHTTLLSSIATSFLITGLIMLFTVVKDEEGRNLTGFAKLFDSNVFKTESLLMSIFGAIAVVLTGLYGLRGIVPYIINHRLIAFFEKKYAIKLNRLKMGGETLDTDSPRTVQFTRRLIKLHKVINFKVAIEMTEEIPALQKKYLKLFDIMKKYDIIGNINK